MTQSVIDNLEEKYKELLKNQEKEIIGYKGEEKEQSFGNILFPIVKKVTSKTIGLNLSFASKEEIEEVETRVKSENRENYINSIINGTEYVEKLLEEDEEYKELMKKGVVPMSAPTGNIFYMDYSYGSSASNI
jgi:hypothetical protein